MRSNLYSRIQANKPIKNKEVYKHMTNFKQLRNRSITALQDSNNLLIRSQKLLLLADQLNKELFDKLKGDLNK